MDKDKDSIKFTIKELLEVINEEKFYDLINVKDIDKYVKKFTAYKFFQLMIVAQINQMESLTRISQKLKNTEEMQKNFLINEISTSQLSRKQRILTPEMFERIFHYLVRVILARTKKQSIIRNIGKLYVIDSSTMSMCLSQYPWASFRKTKAGVRLHLRVVVTKNEIIPDKAILLPAKHADRTQMDELVEIEPDAIYLFDRGYVDYKKFDHYCLKNLRFITRLKKNAEIEVLNQQAPDPEKLIFKDAEVYLGNHVNGTKMQHSLRLIETKDQDGKTVTIVTNCFDLTAKEIADLYRYRWKIEIFFKWMKQHLKIKTFYGKSENAVYNQIWIALITYCLQVLMKLKYHYEGSLLNVQRCLVDCLFKGLNAFIKSLFRKPKRTSKGRRPNDWDRQFNFIVQQFEEGEVSHLDDLTYDPLFL